MARLAKLARIERLTTSVRLARLARFELLARLASGYISEVIGFGETVEFTAVDEAG